MPLWSGAIQARIESVYLTAPTPWQQSGKSGTSEEWVRLRIPICECIESSGTFLDMGCANEFLLECLMEWTKQKGLDVTPYGLDYSCPSQKPNPPCE